MQAQKRADAQLQKQNTLLINQNKMLANNILTLEQKFAAITEGMVIRVPLLRATPHACVERHST